MKNSLQQPLVQVEQNGNFGIGTTVPTAKLHTDGTVRFQGLGTNTANTAVVTIDANGNVTTRTLSDWVDDNTITRIGVGGTNYSSGDINLVQGPGMALLKSGNTVTFTTLTSGLGGSGIPTQVAFWNSITDLTSSANLYWDNTNSGAGVGGSGTATRVAFWSGAVGAASTTLSSDANLY